MVRIQDSAVIPVLLTVEEAAAILRIGRTFAYDLAKQFIITAGAEGLPVVRVGRLLRVPRESLESFINSDMPNRKTSPNSPTQLRAT
jgi:excisionase family DNA binding protein